MRIEEVMTRDVITVAPETPLREVAELLVANRISGVPVCSAGGDVVGVVSEADILRKLEGVAPDLTGPLAWLARRLDGELDKIGARTAGEAMSAPALTARPGQQVAELAHLMVDHMINRVPIVTSGGRLVGIVSRADLIRAFVRSDDEIEREIRLDVLLHMLSLAPGDVEVSVRQGSVAVEGQVATRQDAEMLERCVRRVPGVVDATVDLDWPVFEELTPAFSSTRAGG